MKPDETREPPVPTGPRERPGCFSPFAGIGIILLILSPLFIHPQSFPELYKNYPLVLNVILTLGGLVACIENRLDRYLNYVSLPFIILGTLMIALLPSQFQDRQFEASRKELLDLVRTLSFFLGGLALWLTARVWERNRDDAWVKFAVVGALIFVQILFCVLWSFDFRAT